MSRSGRQMFPLPTAKPPVVCRCGEQIQLRWDGTTMGLYWHLGSGDYRCADGSAAAPAVKS